MARFRRSVGVHAHLAALLLLGSAPVACSSNKPDPSQLSVASRAPHRTAEEQWLHGLQMVTVIGDDGKPTQVDLDEFKEALQQPLYGACFGPASQAIYGAKDITGNLPNSPECIGLLTNIRAEICFAQTLLAASTLQIEPLNIPGFGRIPQQTEETSEALAELAIEHAHSALDNATQNLFYASAPNCIGDPENTVTTGTDFTTAFTEAYNTEKEAFERAIETTLNASDRMRSRAVSPNDGAAKAISGAKLSRAAAAHLLVGGAPGLAGKTDNPLCVDSQLSPQAKTALQLFRNAAPAPSDILDEALPLVTLVNGSNSWNGEGVSQPRDGSLRERLFQFSSNAALAPGGKTVEQLFNLNQADFAAAREFLKQEITAFSRVSSAQLDIPASGKDYHRFYRYSGTAKEPTELPAVAWTARARYGLAEYTGTSSSLDSLLDVVYSRSSSLMQSMDFDSTNRSEALAPLSMLLSGREILGKFYFYSGMGFAYGLSKDDRLRVVVGETGLRCAVQGNVEGASCADPAANPPSFPCAASGQPSLSCLTLTKLDAGWDSYAYSSTQFEGTVPDTRLYLVRPRTPSSPELPGYFEALTGTTVTDGSVNEVLITPSLDQRVAEVLAPSKKYCSVPQVSCAGVTMDARLPLEDELSNDNDGVESSWKHYLSLAKEAAQEADTLGQDYINSGLTVNANAAENQVRQEEQLQRANDALQEVQSTCGTAVDAHALLGLLVSSDGDKKISASTVSCSQSSDCATGYDCRSGSCIPNLGALASLHSDEDPDLRRLAACLDDREANSTVDPNVGTYPFVTLGDQVQCVTVLKADHKQVCPAGNATCPSSPESNGTCAQPSDTSLVTLPAKPLSYYSSDGAGSGQNVCDILRVARANPRAPSQDQGHIALYDLIKTGLLHPMRAQASMKKVLYQPKYGGYFDMGFDGVAAHTDGTFTVGADQSGWPCTMSGQTPSDTCTLDGKEGKGLFCTHINCNDKDKRNALGNRVADATLAAGIMLAAANTDSWDDVVKNALSWTEVYTAYARPLNDLNLSSSYLNPPPTVDPNNPGDTQTQYFHGTGSAVLRNNFGYYITDAPRDDGSDFYTNSARLGVNQFAFFDWPLKTGFRTNVDATISPREFFWAELSDFRNGTGEGHPVAWLRKILEGYISSDQALASGLKVPAFDKGDWSGFQHIDNEAFLDGLELICEGVSVKSNGRASGAPPSITTFEDIGRAGDYLTGTADAITKHASRMVFADIPAIALDAGRESSSFGAFPQLGGKMGEAVISLRIALLQVRTSLPAITGELNQFGAELKAMQAHLQKDEVLKKIRDKQLESTILNQLSDCASAASSLSFSSAVRCANAAAQIGLSTQINDLENQAAALDSTIAQEDFAGKAAQHARALQEVAISLGEASEQIDSAAAVIDSLKKAAKVSVAKAVYLASWQGQEQVKYTRALGTLKTEKQKRYGLALTNAKRLSFFAKRSIEQRLGVQLSEMHDDLPLVAAPATWEGKLCDMTGVDFDKLQDSSDTSYSEGFIGDYVTKLGNLVESYRIQNNFRQGSDVAVVSLRDDVMNVRSECDVPSSNLLLQSAKLDARDAWQARGCKPIVLTDIPQSSMNCLAAVPTGKAPIVTGNQALSGASGYEFQFGDGAGCTATTCGWQPGAGLFQTIHLDPGLYRLSWYTPIGFAGTYSSDGANAGRVLDATGTDLQLDFTGSPLFGKPEEWLRAFATFSIENAGEYQVGFGTSPTVSTVPAAFGLAAPMLELLPLNGKDMDLRSFERTTTTRNVKLAVCEDTDGAIFRATQWKRDCVHVCDSGFSNNCAKGPISCYREATFGISQSAIQSGKVFNFSGFAKGNFNYRIDRVALNFVGTGIRDCSNSLLPTTCSSAGFVTYSFDHTGPFFVRNFDGNDFRAFLFDGHIEQARALASERYITNPLGSSDRGLLADYERAELQGRPLDGNFAIRVWEDPSINFEHIQDVQLILNYSYWTRFK